MMKDEFAFKQFTIKQDLCAMKVGTDGVLLGTWAQGGSRILDVGTGTGLIALLMAQRFPNATLEAIDVEESACKQAEENFLNSPFSDRLQVFHTSLQTFQPNSQYDAIVCNPPYFVDSLKNPDIKRSIARHTDALPFKSLFHHAARLLKPEGEFSIIIPVENIAAVLAESYISGFFTSKTTWIKTTANKPAKRALLAFSKSNTPTEEHHVSLLDEHNMKSKWYRELTEDFYL